MSEPRGFRRARKPEAARREGQGSGVVGGVKRLTVCYHGNATPLRQEEPESGPLRSLRLSVHPINGALSCSRERAKGEESDDAKG